MTREITHMKAFTAALDSLGKPQFSIGRIPPTPILVDQFFNDSSGAGDEGEMDARGPGIRAASGSSSPISPTSRVREAPRRDVRRGGSPQGGLRAARRRGEADAVRGHEGFAAYGTARALAGQRGRPDSAELLSRSLAEEESADNLLT